MTALPSAVLTTDLHGSGRPPATIRPRLRLLYLYWPLIAFVLESAVGWFVLRLDLWVSEILLIPEPIFIMISLGAALAVVPRMFRSRRRQIIEEGTVVRSSRPRASAITLAVVAVLVVCAYLIGLPLKMSINNSSAMRVVNQLLPQVQGTNSECWTTDSDLQAVASLISASKVCASPAEPTYGIGQQVWWESSSSGATLVYSTTPLAGAGEGAPSFDDACVQNIYGPWWALIQPSPDAEYCPSGFSGTGSA